MRAKRQFFKNKFLISTYDQDELLSVTDNIKEFAAIYDKEYHTARSIISRIFNKKQNNVFYFKGKKLSLYFIPLNTTELKLLKTTAAAKGRLNYE